jgi:hypothetical protein
LKSSGHKTVVKLARLRSSFKNQPDGFTNFFLEHQQQHQQHHPQPFDSGAVF